MRLIDADAFREHISVMGTYSGWNVIKEIDARPTIEIAPIVRCRECVHYIKHDKRCGIWNHGGIVPYGFCFLGERRTDD